MCRRQKRLSVEIRKHIMILTRITRALTFLLMLVHAGGAMAQQAPVGEYEVKAAFLYNFAKFVEWPEVSGAGGAPEFVIGILGQDPFGSDIAVIEGKSVNGKILKIVRSDSLAELNNCQVLFISGPVENRLDDILKKLGSRPILTVGDTHGFAHAGIMINLFKKDNKIRFEINPTAAEKTGLRISSHLLRLARIIDPYKGTEQ
jgi:hypothetical protein